MTWTDGLLLRSCHSSTTRGGWRYSLAVMVTAVLLTSDVPTSAQTPTHPPISALPESSQKAAKPQRDPTNELKAERTKRNEQRKAKRKERPKNRKGYWNKLPPKKREALRRLNRLLKQLPKEQRKLLFGQLQSLDRASKRNAIRSAKKLLKGLPEQLRSELQKMAPGESLRRLREMSRRERRRQRIRVLTAGLDAELQAQLKALPPERKRRRLREIWLELMPPRIAREVRQLPPDRVEKRLVRFYIMTTVKQTFASRQDVETLRKQEPTELQRILLGREAGEKPPYLADESWTRWWKLPIEVRRRIVRFLKAHPERRHRQKRPR